MKNFGWDVLILVGLCLLAILFAKLAYAKGAPVWRKKFYIPRLNPHDSGFLCSGEIGECINLAMIASVLFVILLLASDANLVDFIADNAALVILAVPSVYFLLWFFFTFVISSERPKATRHVADQRKIEEEQAHLDTLMRGYSYYMGYCTIVCCLILLVVGITVTQVLHDYASFTQVTGQITSKFRALEVYLFDHPPALSSFLQERFEEIIGKATIARGYIVEQMNSILMLLLCIVVVHTAVARSGLRRVYTDTAYKALTIAVVICAVFAVAFGTWIFFTMHLTFVDSLLSELQKYEVRMNKGPWDVTQRYHELVGDLSARRGIFGFVVSLAGDRGGLLLLIPAVQWVLSRGGDAKEPAKTRARAPARVRGSRHSGRIARRARI